MKPFCNYFCENTILRINMYEHRIKEYVFLYHHNFHSDTRNWRITIISTTIRRNQAMDGTICVRGTQQQLGIEWSSVIWWPLTVWLSSIFINRIQWAYFEDSVFLMCSTLLLMTQYTQLFSCIFLCTLNEKVLKKIQLRQTWKTLIYLKTGKQKSITLYGSSQK